MQHMLNATKIGSAILRWHMNATLDNMVLYTYSRKYIEMQCSLNDAQSPVHARQMNGCTHASIRILIEICPKTNHQKLISKREKDVGLEDMHTHTHPYYKIVPSRRRV